jgi:ectoine hydroxylase-related dioxygenase (phytanoyl-CoA dioxygenase family)
MIDVCLGKSDKKLTFEQKYLYLFKKNPKLKSHFYDCIAYLDCLNQISTSEKTLKIVKKLLGEKTVLYSGSQVRMDHPNDPYYLPQHQELGQMSNRLVLFYVPLVNLDKKIGGINLRPKTHKLGFVRYKGHDIEGRMAGNKRSKIIKELFEQAHLKKYKSINLNLKAGDALIFHNHLFHGTNPNLEKKKIRTVYLTRFNSINKTPYLKNSKSKLFIPYTANYDLI